MEKVDQDHKKESETLSTELENLRMEVKEQQTEVEDAHQEASGHLRSLRLQLEELVVKDEREIIEKIDDLQALQKETLEEKRKILHAFQDLVEKKENVCLEYERNLKLFLTPKPLV